MEYANRIPQKSSDIEIHRFNRKEYLIKQTFYGHQINVNENTIRVLNLVDGKRRVKDISDELSITMASINEGVIYELLYDKLARFGIIDDENKNIERRGKPNYLKLSFTLLKKEWIKPFARFLSPLFSKSVFYPLLLLNTVIVFTILLLNFNEVINFLDYLNFHQWVTYILVSGLILFFHEFGHASSCYRFGAEYGEIGFGFYLFTPVMFADVSDVWKLEPYKRVIVNLAGMHLELFLGAIFSILFLISDNFHFLVLSSIVSFTVLTNLNPFLRYDGYWILSDLAGVPNLRKESNRLFLSIIKGNKINIDTDFRKNVLLLLYAFISNFMITFILASIIIYDPNDLIYFPKNIYNYVTDVINGNVNFVLSDIYKFILPFIFYYIVLRFLVSITKNYIKI